MLEKNRKTILVIDDDPDFRECCRIVLDSAGFNVREAASSEEGLESVQKIKPDAIILDLIMESANVGIELYHKVKDMGIDIPLYLYSSMGDLIRSTIHTSKLGSIIIFQKPIDYKFLLTTLKTTLNVNKEEGVSTNGN